MPVGMSNRYASGYTSHGVGEMSHEGGRARRIDSVVFPAPVSPSASASLLYGHCYCYGYSRGDTLTAHDEVAKQVLHPPTGMLLVAPGVLGERRPHEGDTDGMEDGEAGEGEQRGVDGRRQERADLGSQRGQRGHRAGNGDNCDINILNYPTQSLTSRRRLHFFFPHAISINTIHNLITLFTPYQPEKSPNPPAFFFFFSTP